MIATEAPKLADAVAGGLIGSLTVLALVGVGLVLVSLERKLGWRDAIFLAVVVALPWPLTAIYYHAQWVDYYRQVGR
jgi:hypothetical protein